FCHFASISRGVNPGRLEKPVGKRARDVDCCRHKRLRHQAANSFHNQFTTHLSICGHGTSRLERKGTRKHRKAPKNQALVLSKKTKAPIEKTRSGSWSRGSRANPLPAEP